MLNLNNTSDYETFTCAIQAKVDRLRDALWTATPQDVARYIAKQREAFTPHEVTCIEYTHKMMTTKADDHEAVGRLWDEWLDVTRTMEVSGTERARELFMLADSCMEASVRQCSH